MSIDKRLISTGAAAGCTTDTLDIFGDSSCVALYGLNYDGSDAGGNYDGTPTDVTFNAPGYIDYAASFNGSSSGIDLPNLGISGSQSRTVSFWFNLNATPSGTEQLYSQGTNNLKEAFNIQLTSSAKVQVSYAGREWDSTTALSTGQWYHILVTYNGGNIETSLNTEIYINGTEETLVSGGGSSTGTASTSNTSYSLGYRTNISTLYVDGKMDQVRIYQGVLQQEQITELYNETASDNDDLTLGGPPETIISANANAGFSIVKYEGDGVAGKQVPHGLSAAPEMIIVKALEATANSSWAVYHTGTGNTKALVLNTNSAADTNVGYWNNTSPTASTFTLGTYSVVNENAKDYIAYCFHSVAGYSKFGSYSGSSSTVSVNVGFQPDFVMVKMYNVTGGRWIMIDSVRGDGGLNSAKYVQAQDSAAETTNSVYGLEFTSTGFDAYNGTINLNSSGYNYIYMAFKIN